MGKPSGIRTARKHVKNRRSQVRRCRNIQTLLLIAYNRSMPYISLQLSTIVQYYKDHVLFMSMYDVL